MHIIYKFPFATVLFAIVLYASFFVSISRGNNNLFSESHLILSSYLKLTLKYTASTSVFEESSCSLSKMTSSLSSLSLFGLHIHEGNNGHSLIYDANSKTGSGASPEKETKDTKKLNVYQHFLELYQFFSVHGAFSDNVGDLDVLSNCYNSFDSCPFGACSVCSKPEAFNKTQFHNYARNIVASKFLTFDMGSETRLKRFAFGLVLMNTGYFNKATEHFERLLKDYPNHPEALAAMAVSQFRMDSQVYGNQAVSLLTEALKIQSKSPELYVKRAQLQFLLGNYAQAYNDMSNALSMDRTSWQFVLQRCLVNLALGENEAAFQDAKSAVRLHGRDPHLLLVLGNAYARLGRFRNAAETFKEALDESPDLLDARLRMADCHRVLGSTQRAVQLLTSLLDADWPGLTPDQGYAANKLLAMTHYSAGQCRQALLYADRCLALHPACPACLFRRAAALASLGRFYESIRSATAIMVQDAQPAVVSSPEFLRSHYLREWGRFLRSRLDTGFDRLNFSTDLQREFRIRWILGKSLLDSKNYREESGLQPSQEDVTMLDFTAYNFRQQELICLAKRISQSFRIDTDGAVNNERVLFALGLASVHLGQLIDNATSGRDHRNSASGSTNQSLGWLSLVDLVAKYVQLADLTRPVQLVYTLPKEATDSADLQFTHSIVHRGVPNPPLQGYFNLVFQLAKTMTEHSRGLGPGSPEEKLEFDTAQTLDQVLAVAKRRRTYREEEGGLVVGTQVPSTKFRDQMRHEGAYIYLTEDSRVSGGCSLGIRLRVRSLRLGSYRDEVDWLLAELLANMRAGQLTNPAPTQVNEQLISRTLTLLYYLTNAMPLSHKSGPVAFAVALGILLANGVSVRGRLPPGKSLELEPMLAGTPDAFALVTRQWLKPSVSAKPIDEFLSVGQAFSSVRSVIEVIGTGSTADCPAAAAVP